MCTIDHIKVDNNKRVGLTIPFGALSKQRYAEHVGIL